MDGLSWTDLWRLNKLRALIFLPLCPFRARLLGPAWVRILANSVATPCQVRTLSGIIREHHVARIDLLKIDVEGAEMDVLAGLEESHWPLVRQLSMEVETANKHHLTTLVNRLRSLGFAQVAVESMLDGANPRN